MHFVLFYFLDCLVVQLFDFKNLNFRKFDIFLNESFHFRCFKQYIKESNVSLFIYSLSKAVGRSENPGVPVVIRWA